MSSKPDNKVLDQRISLPKPDVNNITVLTKNLPNEPVLPWHRYDSPWLERNGQVDEATGESEPSAEVTAEAAAEALAEDASIHQLTLAIPESEGTAEAAIAENSATSLANEVADEEAQAHIFSSEGSDGGSPENPAPASVCADDQAPDIQA